jgi:ABC-type branched-subunit amino acid transport system permease subunit
MAGVGLLLLDSEWRLGIIVSAIAAIIGLSVVVLTGLVGQISLLTYALSGIAAFGMVRATEELGLGFPFGAVLGVAAAVVIGTLIGLPAIRVRGLTLAVASLAAAVAVEELVFKWSWFSGGLNGSRAESPTFFGLDLGISAAGTAYPREAFGMLVLVALLLAMILVVNLRRSATGRQWLAVRANERAAEAIGISATRVKLTANAVAAFLAGTAGALLAYQVQTVSADSFGALESLVALAIGYLAGIAVPAGALLAGVLAAGGILTVVLDQVSDGASDYQFAMNGLMLIIVAVWFPAGILGSVGRIGRAVTRDRA